MPIREAILIVLRLLRESGKHTTLVAHQEGRGGRRLHRGEHALEQDAVVGRKSPVSDQYDRGAVLRFSGHQGLPCTDSCRRVCRARHRRVVGRGRAAR
ncbi:MAG: hypothetical protein WCK05_07640 [Planctomycetota bacterium]